MGWIQHINLTKYHAADQSPTCCSRWGPAHRKNQGVVRTKHPFLHVSGTGLELSCVSRTVVNCLFSCIFTAIFKQEQKISQHRNRDTEEPVGKTQCCCSPVYRLHIAALKTEATPLWTSPGMVKHQKMPRVQKLFYFPTLSGCELRWEKCWGTGEQPPISLPWKNIKCTGQLELLKKKKRRVAYKPPAVKYNVFPTVCNNSRGMMDEKLK